MASLPHPLKTAYFLVPGILTLPGRSTNWAGRVATGLFLRGAGAVEKVEYLSGPLLHRVIGQRGRVRKLVRTLSFYRQEEWRWVLVGHSNGAGVILEALRYMEWPCVSALHLVAPACRRGLLREVNAERVVVYQGGKDWPVRLAACRLGRWLGYGDLGVRKPGASSGRSRVEVVRRSEFHHSDWWWDPNLSWMLDRIVEKKEDEE